MSSPRRRSPSPVASPHQRRARAPCSRCNRSFKTEDALRQHYHACHAETDREDPARRKHLKGSMERKRPLADDESGEFSSSPSSSPQKAPRRASASMAGEATRDEILLAEETKRSSESGSRKEDGEMEEITNFPSIGRAPRTRILRLATFNCENLFARFVKKHRVFLFFIDRID